MPTTAKISPGPVIPNMLIGGWPASRATPLIRMLVEVPTKVSVPPKIAETEALWMAQRHLLGEIEEEQVLTSQDVCAMHRLWLGGIYPWAGSYRKVNISKGGFTFARNNFV